MVSLGDRPVGDLVLLSFTVLLGILMVSGVVALVTLAVTRPDINLDIALAQFGNTTSVLTGAILGYVAGRRAAAVPLPKGDAR